MNSGSYVFLLHIQYVKFRIHITISFFATVHILSFWGTIHMYEHDDSRDLLDLSTVQIDAYVIFPSEK